MIKIYYLAVVAGLVAYVSQGSPLSIELTAQGPVGTASATGITVNRGTPVEIRWAASHPMASCRMESTAQGRPAAFTGQGNSGLLNVSFDTLEIFHFSVFCQRPDGATKSEQVWVYVTPISLPTHGALGRLRSRRVLSSAPAPVWEELVLENVSTFGKFPVALPLRADGSLVVHRVVSGLPLVASLFPFGGELVPGQSLYVQGLSLMDAPTYLAERILVRN